MDEANHRSAALMGPISALAEPTRDIEVRDLKTIIADYDRRAAKCYRVMKMFPEARQILLQFFPGAAEGT